MKNEGLIFIPDISGFTRFVNQTEIEHSSHIISELLETLIDTNQLGMEMIEIEGDAILFFKSADMPSLEALIIQAETLNGTNPNGYADAVPAEQLLTSA